MRGLIIANFKVLGTYPNDNDKLIIAKRGSMTSGSSSFSSLDVKYVTADRALFNSLSEVFIYSQQMALHCCNRI